MRLCKHLKLVKCGLFNKLCVALELTLDMDKMSREFPVYKEFN